MIECPECGMENAYFDGVEYVCPDCDCRWDCPELSDEDELQCPECGESDFIYKDDTGQADYICDNCGCRWNADDDDD